MLDLLKTIEYKGIEFKIDPDEGKLYGVFGPEMERKDVYIPATFPCGTKIKTICTNCFGGERFAKVVIDDNIHNIENLAFFKLNAEEVVWPASCKEIPFECFASCKASSILNIDNVEIIGNGAFKDCSIDKIKWPTKCKQIPRLCFCRSDIRSIENMEHITSINAWAFYEAKIKNLNWPRNCRTIPDCCFKNSNIETLSGVDNIEIISSGAFYEANNLKQLDLSSLQIVSIGKYAFGGLETSAVTLPYYVTPDNFDFWFAKRD